MCDLTHSSGRDAALPRNALLGVGCVAFSVAVNVLCHVAVCVPHRPFSSGLRTDNGGVIYWMIISLVKIVDTNTTVRFIEKKFTINFTLGRQCNFIFLLERNMNFLLPIFTMNCKWHGDLVE